MTAAHSWVDRNHYYHI